MPNRVDAGERQVTRPSPEFYYRYTGLVSIGDDSQRADSQRQVDTRGTGNVVIAGATVTGQFRPGRKSPEASATALVASASRAPVDHSLRLAEGALERARRLDNDRRGHPDRVLDSGYEPFSLGEQPLAVPAVRPGLGMHRHRVEAPFAGHLDLVVAAAPVGGQEGLLDLAWEDIDAAENQHVVGPAGHLLHPAHTGPRGAGQ